MKVSDLHHFNYSATILRAIESDYSMEYELMGTSSEKPKVSDFWELIERLGSVMLKGVHRYMCVLT